MKTTRWALLLTVFASAAFGAEVYRSTDANGHVTYSDRPEGPRSEPVFVQTPHAGRPGNTVVARANGADPAQAGDQAGKPANAAGAQAAADGPAKKPEPTPEQRAKNCETARERQTRYAESHRLYRSLPNGEREYLNDAEIDEARARAAADVSTWCS